MKLPTEIPEDIRWALLIGTSPVWIPLAIFGFAFMTSLEMGKRMFEWVFD